MMQKLLDFIRDRQQLEAFLADNRDMIRKVAAVSLLVVAAFFLFMKGGGEETEMVIEDVPAAEEAEAEQAETAQAVSSIYVDVGGAVNNPMVVELNEGSRVEDAIEAAGGITAQADLSGINRAAFVEDGEKIFIPVLGPSDGANADETELTSDAATYQGYSDGRININTADSEELQELSGVGPATAEKIIAYREENGRFNAIEEIKNVSGIGEKTFEKLQDDIRV